MKNNRFSLMDMPICDVCNKPVEFMEWHDDINVDARNYMVSCHGETETATLSALVMITCDVFTDRAFVKERLK
jgi:hypothetical protein